MRVTYLITIAIYQQTDRNKDIHTYGQTEDRGQTNTLTALHMTLQALHMYRYTDRQGLQMDRYTDRQG